MTLLITLRPIVKTMRKALLLFTVTLGMLSTTAFGQKSLTHPSGSVADTGSYNHTMPQRMPRNKSSISIVNPKRTGLYSAILPGLGQAANKQYWKIPVIYAGAAVAAYYIYDNRKNYNEFRSIYIGRLSNNPASFLQHPELTELSQVQDAMNYYRHYLDLTVVLSAAGYAFQIIDAVVFANLKGFDISPDISLKLQPVLYPTGGAGLGLVMNIK